MEDPHAQDIPLETQNRHTAKQVADLVYPYCKCKLSRIALYSMFGLTEFLSPCAYEVIHDAILYNKMQLVDHILGKRPDMVKYLDSDLYHAAVLGGNLQAMQWLQNLGIVQPKHYEKLCSAEVFANMMKARLVRPEQITPDLEYLQVLMDLVPISISYLLRMGADAGMITLALERQYPVGAFDASEFNGVISKDVFNVLSRAVQNKTLKPQFVANYVPYMEITNCVHEIFKKYKRVPHTYVVELLQTDNHRAVRDLVAQKWKLGPDDAMNISRYGSKTMIQFLKSKMRLQITCAAYLNDKLHKNINASVLIRKRTAKIIHQICMHVPERVPELLQAVKNMSDVGMNQKPRIQKQIAKRTQKAKNLMMKHAARMLVGDSVPMKELGMQIISGLRMDPIPYLLAYHAFDIAAEYGDLSTYLGCLVLTESGLQYAISIGYIPAPPGIILFAMPGAAGTRAMWLGYYPDPRVNSSEYTGLNACLLEHVGKKYQVCFNCNLS